MSLVEAPRKALSVCEFFPSATYAGVKIALLFEVKAPPLNAKLDQSSVLAPNVTNCQVAGEPSAFTVGQGVVVVVGPVG
jgi:hypothetical protein